MNSEGFFKVDVGELMAQARSGDVGLKITPTGAIINEAEEQAAIMREKQETGDIYLGVFGVFMIVFCVSLFFLGKIPYQGDERDELW